MASLQQEPTGTFHIVVRIEGKRFKRSLYTKIESKALSRLDEIQETIDLFKRGRIIVPDEVSTVDFILANGKALSPKKPIVKKPESTGLKKLFDQFFEEMPAGTIETDTLKMMHIHKRHLLRILKPQFDITQLTGQILQQYINKRSKERTQFFARKLSKGSKQKPTRTLVSATTIKKEIVTFGALWRWAKTIPLVNGSFPNHGLRFPKTDEKPPFQTWEEIKRQIRLDELSFSESSVLWACLYLRKPEMIQLLKYVKNNSRHSFVYPMFAMAIYTGARRSEILRSTKSDFDFDQNIVTVRECKRVKGRRSSRRVPITLQLRTIMLDWFNDPHPGGTATFAQTNPQNGSAAIPITKDQAQSNFRNTLDGSRWEKIKGWHCLRHSFISNLASAGVDQRIIDDFVGHTTEDMRRRYRHLFPDVKHAAINQVFG